MVDYRQLYLLLFNAVTDALRLLEDEHYFEVGQTLTYAQLAAEQEYILLQDRTEQSKD